jgi:hypothetical protein
MASRRFSMILLLLLAGVFMFGSEHAEADKKVVATARKEDIPFIKCSVCEAMAKHLVRQVKEKRENSATKKVRPTSLLVCLRPWRSSQTTCNEIFPFTCADFGV